MADKIVTQDPTKPGQFKVLGPTMVGNLIPLAGLDGTGAVLNSVIAFNGVNWIPSAATPSADTASNLGAGAQSFKSKVGADFQFRSIIGTGSVTATQNANDITLNGAVITASNLGAGNGVFSAKVGNDLQFKSLIAGSNITLTPSGTDITIAASATGQIVVVSDQKALGTNGGTATAGSWQTHVINTEDADTGANCVLAANQMTLQPGTYRIWSVNSCWNTNRTQARLQNITDATTLILSDSVASSGVNADAKCVIMGRFTLAVAKVLEIQMQVETTIANTGFGQASSFSTETYLKAILIKE